MPRAFLIKKKRASAEQHAGVSDSDPHLHREGGKTEDSNVEKERAAGRMMEERRNEGSEVEYSSEEDTRSSSHSAELRESPSEVRHPASSPEPEQHHPTDLSMRAASPAFYSSPRCSSPHRQLARASTPPRDRSPLVSPIQSHSLLRHHFPEPHPCVPSPRPIASFSRVQIHRNFPMSDSPVDTSQTSSSSRHLLSAYHHQHQQRAQSPVCGFPASQRQETSPQRNTASAHCHQASPPQVPAPTKRPSDFSTAFLLSRPSDNKRARSPGQVSPAFEPYGHRQLSPVNADKPSIPERKSNECEKIPTISLPTKYSPPCLSVSSWLETHHANMPVPNSMDLSHSKIGKTSECLSPEVIRQSSDHEHFRSRVSLRHDDGFSAFRRNSGHEERIVRGALTSEKTSRSMSSEVTLRHAPSPHERRMLSPPPRDRMLTSSPPPRDRMLVSPRVFNTRDVDTSRHSLDRRLPSSSRVLTTPEKLFAERLFAPGSLALPNPGDLRRGTSTSPAHSERTSSGSESPAAVSPDSSPTQLPRYPGDLPWGQTASSAGPFLHPGLPHPSQHSLFPMGLRYMPGLPLPKPLPDLALPLGYPNGLASAFRSTRPPFVHPAAAAYYSSLHSSTPYPFAFSPPGGDGPHKAVSEEVQQAGLERLEALKALRKSSYEPLAVFQPAQPSAAAPAPSIQQGNCLSPVAAATVLSPRANRASSASLLDPATGRPSEVSDLPLGVTVPPGMGLEGRMGVVKRTKEHEPVRYQCEACSKSYSTFSGLSKHKQFHCAAQVKKEFSCKYCDKTYVSLGALKMHIRTHTLPCKCSVCGKAFSRPWLLQGHVRTHTGEKPFSCTHCARAFADRSNLRAHLQTHSHVKKYSCRACSKTFSRMSLLLKHEDGCCPSMV